jgi:hypothetical protein
MGKPNSFARYCRHLAHAEARALREMYRTHGRIPKTAPLVIDLDEWQPWRIADGTARRKAGR